MRAGRLGQRGRSGVEVGSLVGWSVGRLVGGLERVGKHVLMWLGTLAMRRLVGWLVGGVGGVVGFWQRLFL